LNSGRLGRADAGPAVVIGEAQTLGQYRERALHVWARAARGLGVRLAHERVRLATADERKAVVSGSSGNVESGAASTG